MLKLGMTGTQNGTTLDQLDSFLNWMEKYEEFDEFHHGDCVGADKEICDLIQFVKPEVHITCHPPKNPYKRAYCDYDSIWPEKEFIERNHDIVDCVNVMVAFPGGTEIVRSGTWATIRYAKKQHVELYIFEPDGEIHVY